jgi:hypothetical protein
MTIDIAELFARREHERDAPRQNPKIRHRTAVQTNFISRKVALGSKTENTRRDQMLPLFTRLC